MTIASESVAQQRIKRDKKGHAHGQRLDVAQRQSKARNNHNYSATSQSNVNILFSSMFSNADAYMYLSRKKNRLNNEEILCRGVAIEQ